MKAVILVVYVAMAVWLMIAAVARVAILLRSGSALDPIPFISGALGVVGVIVLVPAFEEWREHRQMDRGDDHR